MTDRSSVRDRLARVQHDGHRAIDAIYAPLAIEIAKMIMRHAVEDGPGGVLRIVQRTVPAIQDDMQRMLTAVRPKTAFEIVAAKDAAIAAAAIGHDPVPERDVFERSVDAFHVSAMIGAEQPGVIKQASMIVLRGVVTQLAARFIAKRVKEYFFHRDPTSGLIQLWPGRANMASQHPRTIMLTETTEQHAITMRRIAERDGFYLRWNVSVSHPRVDQCDSLRGIYPPHSAPRMPSHPRCRCYFTTVRVEDGRVLS